MKWIAVLDPEPGPDPEDKSKQQRPSSAPAPIDFRRVYRIERAQKRLTRQMLQEQVVLECRADVAEIRGLIAACRADVAKLNTKTQ